MKISIRQALTCASQLEDVSDTPRLDAEVLLAHVLQKNKTYLYTWPERVLTAEQEVGFEALLTKRKAGCPVAYLVGYREFWALKLKVSEATLIPRPETELLVQLALAMYSEQSARSVADLGTGTGAIALAIASERPEWQVVGCDASPESVRLAEQNRAEHGLDNVQIIESDWCQALKSSSFDLIVSNPPYIDPEDPHLEMGDVRFEPHSALVAEEAGLRDIRTIAGQAKDCLKPGGRLLMEHGYDQADEVQKILHQAGYENIKTHLDLAGLDRATQCRWPG